MRYQRGSITKRGKSYRIQIYLSPGERYTETHRDEKKAKARLRELSANLYKGIMPSIGSLTVSEHLNQWLKGYVMTNCSQRTLDGYQAIVARHLVPALGHYQLKHLNQQDIQGYYGKTLEKLSSRTVHHQHRVLSQVLKYAVRQGYLGRNTCDLVDPPSPKGKAMRTLTESEVTDLLMAARDSYYYPLIYAAISTGLRQAELLGLRWRDIDIATRSVLVNQVLYKRRGVY